jgi:hypothetical protein
MLRCRLLFTNSADANSADDSSAGEIVWMPIMTSAVIIIGLFEGESPHGGVCRGFTASAPDKTPVAGVAWTIQVLPVIPPKAVKAAAATILKSFMFSSLGR